MGLFDQIKQGMQMRSEAKKIQAAIAAITSEYSNGGITAVAKGDFTIASIKISPEAWAEAAGGKPERFETMLFNVINGALKGAKKQVEAKSMEMMRSGNLGNLFG